MNHNHTCQGMRPRIFVGAGLLVISFAACSNPITAADRPNVIVIMSDDQGGGDYGFIGNELIRTPELDAMHARSGTLTNFYVSPVCAPTRASLMTGRYNYRTRCVDTWVGRAMMDPEEVTIAEMLRDAGYKTGNFGKWHLGDNYPMRAMDQGFQHSLVHRGGGIGQPSDPIGAEGKYTDPTLFENGMERQIDGYCTDIFFDAAMEFIDDNASAGRPFFTYIATNAPHGPFHDVPQGLYDEYRKVDFSPIMIGNMRPGKLKEEHDKLARIAAMITNIDENVGRLFSKLDELKIRENTIVIYLNDNGPNTMRYVGNMRGMKTNVDDGGIRSPLLFHWPATVSAGHASAQMCAHIDVAPTILDACDVALPAGLHLDGRSFLPLLTDAESEWPARRVVFQSHRGNVPQLYNHFAIHEAPWKLVHPSGFGNERYEGQPKLELYDLSKDPRQENDLANQRTDVVKRLRNAYEAWYEDVSSTRADNYAPPRIVIGTDHEPSTVLTRQDWRHSHGKLWAKDSNGYWLLEAPESQSYEVEIIFATARPAGVATITAGDAKQSLDIVDGSQHSNTVVMKMPAGKFKLAVEVAMEGKNQGPHQVILTRQ